MELPEGSKGKAKKGKGDGKKGSSKGNSIATTRARATQGKVKSLAMDPLAKKPALATTAASLDTCGRTVGPLEEEQQTKDRSPKGPPKRNAKGGKGVSSLEENKPEAETAETDYLSIAGLEEWSEDEVKVGDTEVGEAAGSTDADYVTVQVEPDRFAMVKPAYDTCSEPCDSTLVLGTSSMNAMCVEASMRSWRQQPLQPKRPRRQ